MLGLVSYDSDSDSEQPSAPSPSTSTSSSSTSTSTSTISSSASSSTSTTSGSLFSSLSSLPAPKTKKKKSKRKRPDEDDLFIPTAEPTPTPAPAATTCTSTSRATSLTSLLPAPKFAATITKKQAIEPQPEPQPEPESTPSDESTIIDAGDDTYPDTSAAYVRPISAAAAAYAVNEDGNIPTYDTTSTMSEPVVKGLMDRKFTGRSTIDPSQFISINQADLTHKTIQEELHAQMEQQYAPKEDIKVNATFWNAQSGTQTIVTDSQHMNATHKRKHQINTLAVQAAAMELQLAKQRASGTQARMMARAKYGW